MLTRIEKKFFLLDFVITLNTNGISYWIRYDGKNIILKVPKGEMFLIDISLDSSELMYEDASYLIELIKCYGNKLDDVKDRYVSYLDMKLKTRFSREQLQLLGIIK